MTELIRFGFLETSLVFGTPNEDKTFTLASIYQPLRYSRAEIELMEPGVALRALAVEELPSLLLSMAGPGRYREEFLLTGSNDEITLLR